MEKRPIVVDTGPLLIYLAIRYLKSNEAPKARRDQILTEIRRGKTFAETEQERFLKLMNQRTFTTAHVISEVLKVRNASSLSSEREDFRRNSLDVLSEETISEIPCPIMEVCSEEDFRQLICLYGLTDAGLVFVASTNRALILTDDERFYRYYSEKPGYVIELLDNYLRETA